MCNPASLIITIDRVLWSQKSDSHEVIIREHGLDDGRSGGDFVRVEITPPNDDYTMPIEQWVYLVDQDTVPDWYDAREAEAAARAELPEWYAYRVWRVGRGRTIRDGESRIVLGGRVRQVGGLCTAYGGSTVTQSGGECRAYDNSTVTQSGGECVAYGHAAVTQHGGECWAYGHSTVTQSGGVCHAYGNSAVIRHGGRGRASENATIIDRCEVQNYNG